MNMFHLEKRVNLLMFMEMFNKKTNMSLLQNENIFFGNLILVP